MLYEVTPALRAWQALGYVLPSQPQTGAYSIVQGPLLILAGSMQAVAAALGRAVWQPATVASSRRDVRNERISIRVKVLGVRSADVVVVGDIK